MRVLFLCPRWPYPVRKGDQVVAYHRLRTLSRDHELTLVSFADEPLSQEQMAPIAELCKNVYVLQTSKRERALAALKGVWSRDLPMQVAYYQSKQLEALLEHLLAHGAFDVVHSLLLRLAPPLAKFSGRVVLELIDSMELNFRRQLTTTKSPLKRLLVREEYRRLTRFEPELVEQFPLRTVVSEIDRMHMGEQTVVLPNGVVIPDELPLESRRTPGRLVFHGNLGYHANQAAVRWLMDDVWPRLKALAPERSPELVIAGANPPRWIEDYRSIPGVEVLGNVADVPTLLQGAVLALAPMRSGSGIQNKVLEAMAAGLPVVATTFAIGGDRKSTRLNSSHIPLSRMPSSA